MLFRSDPTVDAKLLSDKLKITVTLNLSGLWKPQFEFDLCPVDLEPLDVINAQLRDAQEEIQRLRVSSAAYLSLSSHTATARGQMVTWNGNSPRIIIDSHFLLAKDMKSVTVKEHGIYQVYCRLLQTNHTNAGGVELLVGDQVEIGRAHV